MKQFCKTAALLTLIAVMAAPLSADDEKKKGKEGKGKKGSMAASILKKLEGANLEGEQKEKIQALAKTWGPKMAEATKKAALTDDQKAARKEAFDKAKADGKKGKDLQAAVAEALGLNAEQKAAQEAAGEIRKKFMAAVAEILTPEQRKAAKLGGQKGPKDGKGKKPEGKKKPDGEKKKKTADAK